MRKARRKPDRRSLPKKGLTWTYGMAFVLVWLQTEREPGPRNHDERSDVRPETGDWDRAQSPSEVCTESGGLA